MRKLALILILGCIGLAMAGCSSETGDPALAERSPDADSQANVQPNTNKQMPTMGGPSSMDSKPLAKPTGQ
jgi:hypothetical protein